MNEFEFWNDLDKIFEAIVAYQEKTIEFNKRFINPWVNLGYVFEKKENHGTITAHRNAIEIDPANARRWSELASAYMQSGDFEKAIQAYQRALDLGDKSGELYKNLGMAYAMTARYQEAIPALQNALERFDKEKEKAIIWDHLGNVYRKLNDYERAFQAFQQADRFEGIISSRREVQQKVTNIEDPADRSQDKNKETSSVQTTDETDEAGTANELTPAKKDDGVAFEDPDPEFEQESDLEGEEHGTPFQSPIRYEDETLEEDSNDDVKEDMPILFEMDFSNKTLEEYLENESPVIDHGYEKEPTIDPLSVAEKNNISIFEEKHQTRSLPNVEKATKPVSGVHNAVAFSAYEEYLNDHIKPIGSNWSEYQLDEKRTVTMISDEVKVTNSETNRVDKNADLTMDIEAKNAQVWNELGNIYLNAGSLEDAIAAYIKAIELDKQFAWPYTNLAMAYVQQERFEEAILLYQRSIELFSEDKEKAITWNRLGNLYRRLEDYEKAIASYQRADDLDPGNPELTNRTKFSLLGSEKIFQGIPSTL